jgi:hypothetical protein
MPAYRKWNPPVPTLISDLHGWISDIDSAREFAERLVQESEKENPDTLLVDALTTAAIIRYNRCFTTGFRARLEIDRLSSATAADVDLHERICAIRNLHIAHAVNEQEVHALYVIVDDSREATTGALGFSSQATSQIPLLPDEAVEMTKLCNKWVQLLKEQLAQENFRLMPLVTQLSREDLFRLPEGEPESNEDVHSRRKRRPRDA